MTLPTDFAPRLEDFNIVAVSSGKRHRIAKIIFGPDGSIYAMFPGFTQTHGLAAQLTLTNRTSYPANLNLADYGKVTGHLVKYSHHPDGWAQFSQAGKVKTEIRKKSCPLDTYEGHLFTIQVQGLGAFNPPRSSDKTPPITLNIEGAVRALKIVGFRNNLSNMRTDATGPRAGRPLAMRDRDGSLRPGIAVAPPIGNPSDNFVLFLVPEEIPWLSEDQEPCLIFLGGFDERKIALDHSKDTSFLGLLYPCSDFNKLRQTAGTIDLI